RPANPQKTGNESNYGGGCGAAKAPKHLRSLSMNLIVSARTKLALAMLAGLGLAGCSSQPKFACPALTTGYGCQSMLEVYERTDAPGVSDARQPTEAEQKKSRRAAKRESARSEEHTSELQSRENLVCRLLLEK